jgi:hypothetical protein
MENIKQLLEKKQIQVKERSQRKRNLIWEQAEEFGKYVNLPVPFVMRLIKMFGLSSVMGIRGYLKDFPDNGKFKNKMGLAMYKLNLLKKEKEDKKPIQSDLFNIVDR